MEKTNLNTSKSQFLKEFKRVMVVMCDTFADIPKALDNFGIREYINNINTGITAVYVKREDLTYIFKSLTTFRSGKIRKFQCRNIIVSVLFTNIGNSQGVVYYSIE